MSDLASGLTFQELCTKHRGRSCIQDLAQEAHPAAPWLRFLRTSGAPVLLTNGPWEQKRIHRALSRGCHQSARSYEDFLRSEMADMVRTGHWLVLPAPLVQKLPQLRLAPIGIVPQRERRPRMIVDYSYYGTNDETLRLVPDSMQFGRALQRILHLLERADTRHGPLFLSKVDIADAFMRVPLQLSAIPKLAALLPKRKGEAQLVAFPLVLPMGWVNSPSWFCTVSETIADLANEAIRSGATTSVPPHRLAVSAATKAPRFRPSPESTRQETPALPPPATKSRGRLQPPVACVDIYMDDIIAVAQGGKDKRANFQRLLLHCIDAVLRPLEPDDKPTRKEPASVKKLLKGDACWAQRKVVLGWLIDTVKRTIELPSHRVARLFALLDHYRPTQNSTSRQRWQQLLGELRSMALALPACRGLFSQLQMLLRSEPGQEARPADRLRLNTTVHDALDDFRWLATSLATRPTRWGEIIPQSEPSYLGAEDACAQGMGGVWLSRTGSAPPLLWRQRFADDIAANVISFDNPAGRVTNSDLELAAYVSALDVLTQHADVRERTVHVLSDNTATVHWAARGSVSTDSVAAYLLRLQALHQRCFRYTATTSHIPGTVNQMADILSRRWDLSDEALLTFFDRAFPQAYPWKLCQLRPPMNSAVIAALSTQRLAPQSLSSVLADGTGCSTLGVPFANNLTKVPIWTPKPTPSGGSCSSRSASERGNLPPAKSASDLARWRTPFVPWRRRTHWCHSAIPVWTHPARSTSA
jgi:hypothetical protein